MIGLADCCICCAVPLLPEVSLFKKALWMKELVFDLRNGHVWQTLVKLPISSLRRYSSDISILSGLLGC